MTYKAKKFKDGQVSAIVQGQENLSVKIRGNSYEDLFEAASIKEAWDSTYHSNQKRSTLTILCLIGQRSDRRFNEGESFDLKVIANFINSMNFDQVKILHPHSSVSLALINNSMAVDHYPFVSGVYDQIGTKPVLISPDAGAYKDTYGIAERLGADLVPSNKVRVDGEPKIIIQGDVKGIDCLIVDDIADGGRTFDVLARELKIQNARKVYLYVTHGQFHYGFHELKDSIDHIYCTNSYRNIEDDFVTQLTLFEE